MDSKHNPCLGTEDAYDAEVVGAVAVQATLDFLGRSESRFWNATIVNSDKSLEIDAALSLDRPNSDCSNVCCQAIQQAITQQIEATREH